MAKNDQVTIGEFPLVEMSASEMILPGVVASVDISKYPELLAEAGRDKLSHLFAVMSGGGETDIRTKFFSVGVVASVQGVNSTEPRVLLRGEYRAELKAVKKLGPELSYWVAVTGKTLEDISDRFFKKEGDEYIINPKFMEEFTLMFSELKRILDKLLYVCMNFTGYDVRRLDEICDKFGNYDLTRRDIIEELVWDIIYAMPHQNSLEKQRLIEEKDLLLRIGGCLGLIEANTKMIMGSRLDRASSKKKVKIHIIDTKKASDKAGRVSDEDDFIKDVHPEIKKRWNKFQKLKEFIKEDARSVVMEDLERLKSFGAPEGNTYEWPKFIRRVDSILGLPWKEETPTEEDIVKVAKILDEDHYGLDKPKEQTCDSIAPKILNPEGKGNIICYVGPPGVGKTSLAKSIARALNRKYVRMSVGGIKDEAQIRGHAITYIGSEPGEPIKLMKRCGVKNPVFVIDEIDKLGHLSSSGDPSSAMLEVLDPEQNNSFKDHYLSCGFDLSKIMFIATANVEENIIKPLHDRMEIIRLSGYLEVEKVEIAKRFLIPRWMNEVGIIQHNIQVDWEDNLILWLIRGYTSEAGVRNLERTIATILRKVAREYLESKKSDNLVDKFIIDQDRVNRYLGPVRFFKDRARVTLAGEAIGLAWTPVGGDLLYIQVQTYPRLQDKKVFARTGMQGDVMKESDEVALTCIRDYHKGNKDLSKILSEVAIHLHIPEGAVPKDGPSAGVTMAVALNSKLTNTPVKPNLAMTGEIDLMARILPVGGIREKIVAAERAGIEEVIIPKENERNLHDVPKDVREKLRFYFVENMDQAFEIAFPKDV